MASTSTGTVKWSVTLKAAIAGRDIDAVGSERDVHEAAGGGLRGEVEGDAGAVGLGLAGGVVVDLEDEIGGAVKEGRGCRRACGRGGRRGSSRRVRARAGIPGCRSRDSRRRYRVCGRSRVVSWKTMTWWTTLVLPGRISMARTQWSVGGGCGNDEALVEIGAVGGDVEGGGASRLRDRACRAASLRGLWGAAESRAGCLRARRRRPNWRGARSRRR